jgi:hypothetical protein
MPFQEHLRARDKTDSIATRDEEEEGGEEAEREKIGVEEAEDAICEQKQANFRTADCQEMRRGERGSDRRPEVKN